MTIEEIKSYLCYYDVRNTESGCSGEDRESRNEEIARYKKETGKEYSCSCDDCFYGRTKLAEELLKYIPV